MYKKLSIILAFSLLGTLLIDEISWHAHNRRLPNDDAASYAITAVQKYQAFRTQGLKKGIEFFYRFRNHRQMLFSECAVPFILLSKGNYLAGLAWSLIFCYLALMLFTYLILRDHLTFGNAMTGTAMIMSLPWLVNFSHIFMSEIAMLAALSAALYFGQASHAWTSWKNSIAFGVALGLSLCIRPVEISGVCILFCAYLLEKARYKKSINLFDLVSGLVFCVGAGCLAWSSFLHPKLPDIAFITAGLGIFITAYAIVIFRHNDTNKRFHVWVMLTILLPVLWFLPELREFYSYVYTTTFGPLMQIIPGGPHLDFGHALMFYLNSLGPFSMVILSLTGLFSCMAIFFRNKNVPNTSLVLIGLFSLCLVSMVTSMLAGSNARRCFPGGYTLILGLVVLAACPEIPFYRFRSAILLSLAMAQVFLVTINTLPRYLTKNTWVKYCPYTYPPYSREDPDSAVYEELQNKIPEGSRVDCVSMALYSYRDRIFNCNALNLLAVSKHSRTSYFMTSYFRTIEEGYKYIEQASYNYILLDPNTKTWVDYNSLKKLNPPCLLTDDLIKRYQRNDWSNLNWKPVSLFYVQNRELVLLGRKL